MNGGYADHCYEAEKGATGRPFISGLADIVQSSTLPVPSIAISSPPPKSPGVYLTSNRFYVAMTTHPSLRVNGLPSVNEDHDLASPSAEQATMRESRKMAMLQRMRPPPFTHAWDFYHDAHSTSESYENRLTLITGNIVNIKMFWENQNNFPFSQLKMKDSVHLFKRGVKPAWEDRRNVNGGSWTFRIRKDQSAEFWQELCMMAIGEQIQETLEKGDDLCGISLSTRFNSNLITIWNRDGSNRTSIDNILKCILETLPEELKPKDSTYYYKKHSEHADYREVVEKAQAASQADGAV